MNENFGATILQQRKDAGMTLDQLAEAAGVSKSYLWELENDKQANPSVWKLDAIAKVLGTTISGIIGETPYDDEPEDRAIIGRLRSLAGPHKRLATQVINTFFFDALKVGEMASQRGSEP